MNIFILDKDSTTNARYHVDKHVVKMILESAQLLCTAHHVAYHFPEKQGFLSPAERKQVAASPHIKIPYKPTHLNHPCAIWVRESTENYKYLLHLATDLNAEYGFRYGKMHKSYTEVIEKLPKFYTDNTNKTDFALCMPEQYKSSDPVESYRKYYKAEKAHLASWKNREVPEWWDDQ